MHVQPSTQDEEVQSDGTAASLQVVGQAVPHDVWLLLTGQKGTVEMDGISGAVMGPWFIFWGGGSGGLRKRDAAMRASVWDFGGAGGLGAWGSVGTLHFSDGSIGIFYGYLRFPR